MGRMWRPSLNLFFFLIISTLQVACSLDATLFSSFTASPYTPPGSGTNNGTFVVPSIYAPTTMSHLTNLKTYVHGDDLIAYKFKVGAATSTSCSDEAQQKLKNVKSPEIH